jgi:putative oxidoreductase
MNLRELITVNRNWKINDIGLLIVRVMVSASLFAHHGWEKISGFSHMAQHFLDPLHIGVVPSLAFAAFADAICAVLVILGAATRAASFFILVNLLVVYFIVHNALGLSFLNMAPPYGLPASAMPGGGGDHLEMVFVYLAVYLFLTLVGGGALSVDRKLGGEQ